MREWVQEADVYLTSHEEKPEVLAAAHADKILTFATQFPQKINTPETLQTLCAQNIKKHET